MPAGPNPTLWAILKAPWWNRLEGNGGYTQQGLKYGHAYDNGYQQTAYDASGTNVSNGNIVNTILWTDANGQTVLNNPNGTIISNGSVAQATNTTQISSAQILTLNTAPTTIIPAPGAGKAILLDRLIIEMIRTATAYTGGGVVGPVYAGATGMVLTATTMPAATVTTGGAGTALTILLGNYPAPAVNTAVQLFAGTANFAAGTGTMVVTAFYSIVTL